MACNNINKVSEDLEDMEGLRHFTFKEFAGTRKFRDTPSSNVSILYTQPLKLQRMNI
jgi:hypothetical protein